MNIDSIRKDYTLGGLKKSEMAKDPFRQFSVWLKDAIESENPEPTAMTLSTIGNDGYPQSRIVLLKYTDESGFTFFTNYNSSKGNAIEINCKVALNFFWPELQRQVRVTGWAEKTTSEVSDNYFRSRPADSKLGAWASEQSSEIQSRDELEQQFRYYRQKFGNDEIERPANWGGYKVIPIRLEFWQGRENRLHDRLVYEKDNDGWNLKRLAP